MNRPTYHEIIFKSVAQYYGIQHTYELLERPNGYWIATVKLPYYRYSFSSEHRSWSHALEDAYRKAYVGLEGVAGLTRRHFKTEINNIENQMGWRVTYDSYPDRGVWVSVIFNHGQPTEFIGRASRRLHAEELAAKSMLAGWNP